jgi:hypothetical protein
MARVRYIPNAKELEPIVTDDLLLARDILKFIGNPKAENLDNARNHLGSIVHNVPLKPARRNSDIKSVILIASALREAAEILAGHGATPVIQLLPPAQSAEETNQRNQTANQLAGKLRGHAVMLDGLLEVPYRIKLGPDKGSQLTV